MLALFISYVMIQLAHGIAASNDCAYFHTNPANECTGYSPDFNESYGYYCVDDYTVEERYFIGEGCDPDRPNINRETRINTCSGTFEDGCNCVSTNKCESVEIEESGNVRRNTVNVCLHYQSLFVSSSQRDECDGEDLVSKVYWDNIECIGDSPEITVHKGACTENIAEPNTTSEPVTTKAPTETTTSEPVTKGIITWEVADYTLPKIVEAGVIFSFADNIAYYFGGRTRSGSQFTFFDTIYKLDTTVSTPQWELLPVTMPIKPIDNAGIIWQWETAKVGETVYFYDNAKLYIFDTITDTFLSNELVQNNPYSGEGESLSTDGINYIYVTGGGSTPSQYVVQYDIIKNEWSTLSNNASLQWSHLNTMYYAPLNRIYVFGTSIAWSQYTHDIYYYDLNSNTWSDKIATMSFEGSNLGGSIYIEEIDRFFLFDLYWSSTGTVNSYDPVSNTITIETTRPVEYCGLGTSATTLNNRIQVFGGIGQDSNCRTQELYTSYSTDTTSAPATTKTDTTQNSFHCPAIIEDHICEGWSSFGDGYESPETCALDTFNWDMRTANCQQFTFRYSDGACICCNPNQSTMTANQAWDVYDSDCATDATKAPTETTTSEPVTKVPIATNNVFKATTTTGRGIDHFSSTSKSATVNTFIVGFVGFMTLRFLIYV